MIENVRPITSTERVPKNEIQELERKLLLGMAARRDFAKAVETARELWNPGDRINTLFNIVFNEAPEGIDVSSIASATAADANEVLAGPAGDHFYSSSQFGKIDVLKNLIKYRQGKGLDTSTLEDQIDKALEKEIQGHRPGSGNREHAIRDLRDRYIQRRDYDAVLDLAGKLEPQEKVDIYDPLLEAVAKNGTNRDFEPIKHELSTLREQGQAETINDRDPHADYKKIGRALNQTGISKTEAVGNAMDVAGKIRLFERSREANQAEALHPIVRAQVEAGMLDEALETAQKISRESVRSRALGTVAEAYMRQGNFDTMYKLIELIPYKSEFHWSTLAREYASRGMFEKALEAARIYPGEHAYLDIARAQHAAGIDPMPTLQEAMENWREGVKRNPGWSDLRARDFLEAAEFERAIGKDPSPLIQEAKELYGDNIRPRDLAHLAKMQVEGSALNEQDMEKLGKFMPTLLKQGRDDVAHAIGYIAPNLVRAQEQDIPAHMRHALDIGKAEWDKNSAAIVETGRKVDNEATDTEKRAFSRSLRFHEYGAVSNELLRKFGEEKNPINSIRYLKTLIEIENPKGRTFATKLYADPNLPARQKEYLARKLIDEGHWDKELGKVLEKRIEDKVAKEEIDAVLSRIINKLNLTPDAVVYGLLEKQGLLKEATLDGRVAEIARRKEEFTRFNREELLSLFKKDADAMELYYVFFGGEYSYSLINNYTFEKFKSVVLQINELEIDDGKMDEFSTALKAAGKSAGQIVKITQDLREGRFPLLDNERTFSFESAVEMGSEYAVALNRLQETWSGELRKILILVNEGKNPENMAEVDSAYSDDLLPELSKKQDRQSRKITEMLNTYGVGKKQDRKSVLAYAERMRKELLQRARQQKDKNERDRIETLPVSHIISEYFKTLGVQKLNECGAYSEWTSHISEVLTALEQSERGEQRERVSGGSVQVEATFLDKGRDFIRAVRFADGQQCCFNSGNYEGGGASKWIARLNRDPLSFVVDIKEKDAKEISGFVFGRMGTDPEKGTPVVMLNGIYSRIAGKVFVDNLLGLIEDKFAREIGASAIVLASKHGGSLTSIPTGYEESNGREIIAIRGLKNEDNVYDDIGSRSNGKFKFSGYQKNLA